MLAKIKALAATVWADICDTYRRLKVLIIALGVAIVYLEWNKIQETILLAQGKKELKSDQKQDTALATTEKTDNDAANALVKDANDLAQSAGQTPVTSDWYEKDKK